MHEKTEALPGQAVSASDRHWSARTSVWYQGHWFDVPALARALGFTVPVALSEDVRVQLQETGLEFPARLEQLLRRVYHLIELTQTEDCGFYFLAAKSWPPPFMIMAWGAASEHQALSLLRPGEEHGSLPLAPTSREAAVPPLQYHYLDRPLHSAIGPPTADKG